VTPRQHEYREEELGRKPAAPIKGQTTLKVDPVIAQEFQPTPHLAESATTVELSTPATLTRIFFGPRRVFESLESRPRFLVAALILLVLTSGVTMAMYQRIDMSQYLRDQMEKSQRTANQTEEQKEFGVKFGKTFGEIAIPAFVPFTIAIGAALYFLGVITLRGSISYKKALAVWAYSSLPPAVLASVITVLVLFLKSPDNLNPEQLLITNPSAFMGPDSSRVIVAVLSQFDLLRIYGLILAAIGLRKVAKISLGSAWGVVLGFYVIRAALAIGSAAILVG
jgi:uncharacterized membrane protein